MYSPYVGREDLHLMHPPDDSIDTVAAATLSASPAEPVSAPDAPPKPSRPRIWPVFVVFLLVCVGVVVAQIPVTVWLIMDYLSHGGDLQRMGTELGPYMAKPWNFIALAASSQAVLAAAAIVPAWLSPVPLRQRLGMVPMTPAAWWYPVIAVGAWLPAIVGLGLALALATVLPADETPKNLYDQMTWAVAGPFIAFIALAPGIFEELLFRGYMQRRLLERWPAWVAIGVTSLLFALLHVMPHAVVFAFPIGVWLGIVAWRTGSVWPGAICHAFINGSWNVYQIGTHLQFFADPLPVWVVVAGGLLIVVCFGASLWRMTRGERLDDPFRMQLSSR